MSRAPGRSSLHRQVPLLQDLGPAPLCPAGTHQPLAVTSVSASVLAFYFQSPTTELVCAG